jgi:hypothetical protein
MGLRNYGMEFRKKTGSAEFFLRFNFTKRRNYLYGMKKTTEILLFRAFKLRNFSLLKNGITMTEKNNNSLRINALDLLKNQKYFK